MLRPERHRIRRRRLGRRHRMALGPLIAPSLIQVTRPRPPPPEETSLRSYGSSPEASEHLSASCMSPRPPTPGDPKERSSPYTPNAFPKFAVNDLRTVHHDPRRRIRRRCRRPAPSRKLVPRIRRRRHSRSSSHPAFHQLTPAGVTDPPTAGFDAVVKLYCFPNVAVYVVDVWGIVNQWNCRLSVTPTLKLIPRPRLTRLRL